jgi:cysteine-rich repeat protein
MNTTRLVSLVKLTLCALGALATLLGPARASAQCVGGPPDGRVLLPEDCDDGNGASGDGCSASCEVEPGYTCRLPFAATALVTEDYAGAASSWVLSADGRSGTQLNNSAMPVIGLFGADAGATTYRLQVRVETTGDDDFVGLVLGWSPGESASAGANYLLVDWKQLDQAIGGGTARRGMALSRVSGIPGGNDFWLHNGRVTELARAATLGDTGWSDLTTHDFTVTYSTSRLIVAVDGVVQFDLPGPWPDGQVGFYGLSQSSVTYAVGGPLTSACTPRCGDSLVGRPLESCDDGGTSAGDGCDASCRLEVAITSPLEAARTNDSTPTVTGTADPGATVTVVVGGVTLMTTADASGSWSVTVPAGMALPDGPAMATATAVTSLGGTSTDAVSFAIDSRTTVAITTPTAGSTTSDATPAIRGTGEPGATVDVIVDEAVIATVTVGADGTWSTTVPTPLSDGSHRARAEARDGDGNTATSGDVPFTIDTATAVDVTGPAGTTRDATPEVTGTGEPGSVVVVMVGGLTLMTTVAADGTWTVTPTTDLPNGTYVATATATDAAGNTATDTQSFRVDAGTFVDLLQPTGAIGDSTPEISGTAEPGARVEVRVDGRVIGTVETDDEGNWTLVVPTPLAEGTHAVSVTATATSGSTASDTGSFVLDTSRLPGLELRSPGDGTTTSDPTPPITGHADPGAVVTVEIDGVVVGTATADADGHWSLELTAPLAEGSHVVVASTPGADGTMAVDTADFTVALGTVEVTLTAPPDGARIADRTPRITGTADPGATVEVYVDGALVGTVTAAADGTWSLDTASSLPDGEHTLRAVATAGARTATASGSFTVDASTTVAITEPADGATIGTPRPTYTGTAEPGATVTVLVDGVEIGMTTAGPDGSWSLAQPTDLALGGHTVVARAEDDLGNRNETDHGFTYDPGAPDAGPRPDAAVSTDAATPGADAGRPDASSTPDASSAPDAFVGPTTGTYAGGACGCAVPSRGRTPAGLVLLALAGLLIALARRRR